MKKKFRIQDNSINISRGNDFPLFALGYEVKEFITYPLLHSSARFWYIVGGEAKVIIQGYEVNLKKGSLVGILPWQYTEIKEVKSPLKMYIVVYEMEQMDLLLKSYDNVFGKTIKLSDHVYKNPMVYLNENECKMVDRIFQEIENEIGFFYDEKEIKGDRALTNFLLTSYLVEIYTIFIRASQEGKNPDSTRERKIIELFHYIYYNLNSNITLSSLSKRFYMSESAISKYIKDTIGITYSELTSIMKLSKLMYFLTFSNKTLQELAIILGYTDASHLTKFFKSHIGVPIGMYKKNNSIYNNFILKFDIDFIQEIFQYVINNYSQDLKSENVSKMFKISVSDLNNIFLNYFNKSFNDYLNYARIVKASEILLSSDKLISDIALEVGYNNSKTFNRNFTKIYSMSPNEFKKKINMQSTTL